MQGRFAAHDLNGFPWHTSCRAFPNEFLDLLKAKAIVRRGEPAAPVATETFEVAGVSDIEFNLITVPLINWPGPCGHKLLRADKMTKFVTTD